MSGKDVIAGLDECVNEYALRTRIWNEPITLGRAQMFVLQHRQNTRQRNSVLKLRVATNCPVWDVKMRIIEACAEEIIADDKFADGRPHWEIVEDLGVALGLKREDIQNSKLLDSTRRCWLCWEALMSNRHWLEGLIANTCAERANVPGYGKGEFRDKGWSGMENRRWAETLGLEGDQLAFFKIHGAADLEHSNLGWHTVARYAKELGMEDAIVEACRVNLMVWTHYFDGIVEAGDQLDKQRRH